MMVHKSSEHFLLNCGVAVGHTYDDSVEALEAETPKHRSWSKVTVNAQYMQRNVIVDDDVLITVELAVKVMMLAKLRFQGGNIVR